MTIQTSGSEPLGATVDENGHFSVTLPEARDGQRPSTAEVRIGNVGASAAPFLDVGSRVSVVDLSSYAAGANEEIEWRGVGLTACRVPSSLDACEATRGYLASYPQGVHADEARAALSAAQPRLAALQKDEDRWKRAGAPACNTKRETQSCVGVELYLNNFPNGLHRDEARAALATKR